MISASLTNGAEFTLIYQRYFDAIYRYVVARLGADAAADIASEVFVRAFENRRSYDLERPLARPWLYGIAANLIRDSLRSRSRRRRAYLRTAGFGDDPEADLDAALDRAHAEVMMPKINIALSKLRTGDREVLLLFAVGGLSYEEVAAAVGIPVGTVRSRLSRSRQRIGELIDLERQTKGERE